MKEKNLTVEPRALLAELFGTFTLTSVAILIGDPILVGFTLVLLVFMTAAISGTHLNPAVSFGMWTIRKISGLKMLAYWVMQFVGALIALFLIQGFKGDFGLKFSLGAFDWHIVIAEMIGMLIFSYAIAAAVDRKLADAASAICIGFGLMVGLYVGGGLVNYAVTNKDVASNKESRLASGKVSGVVLNPAISIAATEKNSQQSQMEQMTGQKTETPKPVSRLSLETVVSALIGGALGMNIYLLLSGANPFVREEAKGVSAAKVTAKSKVVKTKVVKKGKK